MCLSPRHWCTTFSWRDLVYRAYQVSSLSVKNSGVKSRPQLSPVVRIGWAVLACIAHPESLTYIELSNVSSWTTSGYRELSLQSAALCGLFQRESSLYYWDNSQSNTHAKRAAETFGKITERKHCWNSKLSKGSAGRAISCHW